MPINMQKILDIVNPVLDSEPLTDAVRARLRVKLMRAIATNHRQINETLQASLGVVSCQLDEVRGKVEELLYPVPLDRELES